MLELFLTVFSIFAIVVGCVAIAKNRSFVGWLLLSLLITPFFALLALIAVPTLPKRSNFIGLGVGLAFCIVAGIVGFGALMVYFSPSTKTTPTAIAITVAPEPVSIPLPRPRPR